MSFYCEYCSHVRADKALPLLTKEQFEALVESIKEAGQVYVPVIKDEAGHVIDGDARWFISGVLGIGNVPVEVRHGLTDDEKTELALLLNAHRRHLNNQAKRGIIRQQLMRKPSYSSAHLARLIGCTGKTVEAVRCELEARSEIPILERFEGKDRKSYPRKRTKSIAHTDREKKDLFKNLRLLKADGLPDRPLTPRQIHNLARRKERTVKPGQQAPGEYQLYNLDMRELLPNGLVRPHSVNLIMTDPFYQKSAVEDWSMMGEFAREALAEDGLLAAYTGHGTLEDAFDRLRKVGLFYRWLGVNVFNQKCDVHEHNVHSGFRPVLIFSREDKPVPYSFCDTFWLSPEDKERQSNHPYGRCWG